MVQHVYASGPLDAESLSLVHGSVSSGRFFEELLAYIDDFAGSSGLINPRIQARYEAHNDSASSIFLSRSLIRMLYVKPTFRFDPQREDVIVEQHPQLPLPDRGRGERWRWIMPDVASAPRPVR